MRSNEVWGRKKKNSHEGWLLSQLPLRGRRPEQLFCGGLTTAGLTGLRVQTVNDHMEAGGEIQWRGAREWLLENGLQKANDVAVPGLHQFFSAVLGTAPNPLLCSPIQQWAATGHPQMTWGP